LKYKKPLTYTYNPIWLLVKVNGFEFIYFNSEENIQMSFTWNTLSMQEISILTLTNTNRPYSFPREWFNGGWLFKL
jgi:hypothetical protein